MKEFLKRILLVVMHSRGKTEFSKKLRRNLGRTFYKKRYTTNDIISYMKSNGMRKGSNIFIHSSWDEFYNFEGNINDLIKGVLDFIGENGTLAMPAYPFFFDGKTIFDVKKTPTAAGLIAERFRKYNGVKRSINFQHSVCAFGPQSDFLLNEHVLSETCWDKKSPYYKLSEINALVFSFGLGNYFIGTIVHCVDSCLRKDYPYFSQFFKDEKTYKYVDYDGILKESTYIPSDERLRSKYTKRSRYKVVKKYFDKNRYSEGRISNLTIGAYDAKYVVDRLIELGEKGITLYVSPKTKGYF